MHQKMSEADIRKKTGTNAFADFLRRVMPTSSEPASKTSPPPPLQKTRHGTHTDVTPASVTTSPPLPQIPLTSFKEFKYERPKQERGDEDDDEDDYDDDVNSVEDEARTYGRENAGPVVSKYLMPYVYTQNMASVRTVICL